MKTLTGNVLAHVLSIVLIAVPIALSAGEVACGRFEDLPLAERTELVWMAKAANTAYPGVSKPIGYRSFSRMEWDACAEGCDEFKYTEDGYFNVGNSGLRGRLMYNMGRVVLAFSGMDDCDQSEAECQKDFLQCVRHYKSVNTPQYEQALRLMNNVLSSRQFNDLWIVGHSLGGSLTTYLALHLPEGRTRVKCATFNGYGVSPNFRCGREKEVIAARRIRNVYCEEDPVYTYNRKKLLEMYRSTRCHWQLLFLPFLPTEPPRHYGPSYLLKCEGAGDLKKLHSIDNLVKLMIEKRSVWTDVLKTKEK